MNFHRVLSYGLMMAGAAASARSILKRLAWEQANVRTGIMLDWDDVQAVATRAGHQAPDVGALLDRYQQKGATHLSIPELSLARLLEKGQLSLAQGPRPERTYLKARTAALAGLISRELQARLPDLQPAQTGTRNPLISFAGDLPAVAEVGLGFDPGQAKIAQQAGLSPVARPIGYSWIQPAMLERTFDQAAALGARIVAVQGNLIPGHEFKMDATVAAMKRNNLRYAFFRESRHQKGDWFLAKSLAGDGLVLLAHEFQPEEMLAEDSASICYRWANLALEAGIRLCSVRFFKILHAADPLESVSYVEQLSEVLTQAGYVVGRPEEADLRHLQPKRDDLALAMAGLSTAGAAGLAADLAPVSNSLKLLGVSAGALALVGLPFWEGWQSKRSRSHHHHGNHNHQHPHGSGQHPHHSHDHHYDHSPPPAATAYAPKGLGLAATVAFPVAGTVLNSSSPLTAVTQALAVSAAGAIALSVVTSQDEYLQGIEEYRSFNLDWLLPMGLAAATPLIGRASSSGKWRWLPLAGVLAMALKNIGGPAGPDLAGQLDREHQQAHTHHLSAFQRSLGDSKMAVSARPLRKWSLLAPLGVVWAALLKERGRHELAAAALTAATAGQIATLTGFRNGQRPVEKTLQGRLKGWGLGSLIAAAIWLGSAILQGTNGDND